MAVAMVGVPIDVKIRRLITAKEYFFQVTPMRPRDHPGNNNAGDWVPPRAHGKNVKCVQHFGDQDLVFHYRAGITQKSSRAQVGSLERYGTYSLYHDQSNIWTVDHDAILYEVGDGNDSSYGSGSDSDSDGSGSVADVELDAQAAATDDQRRDWTQLKFKQAQRDLGRRLSFVSHNGERGRMLCQHTSHQAVNKVLPRRYVAENDGWGLPPQYGGLVGELPLLIGLLVLAIPPGDIQELLPQLVTTPPWMPPNVDEQACHFDKRGAVVTVWTETQPHAQSVEEYEQGVHGPFFL